MLVEEQIIYISRSLVLGNNVLQTVRLLQFRESEACDGLVTALLLVEFPIVSLKPETITFLQIYIYSYALLVLPYF